MAKAQAEAKQNILTAVCETVQEVQYKYRSQEAQQLPSDEVTNRLCNALEAVFVHGLKETFLGKLSSRLAGQEATALSPKMPEPSFWTFALVFSHKEVIGQVEGLGQVWSEVGRARAWLRLALNDGLLVSYLAAMAGDQRSLATHYQRSAFLRDPERRDLARSCLAGLTVFTFGLAVNVSTLNRWQPGPLVLAAVWRSPTAQLDLAADVAAELEEESEEPQPEFLRSLAQPITEGGAGLRRGLLNEEEALRLILQSTPIAFSPNLSAAIAGPTGEEEPDLLDLPASPTLEWDHPAQPSPASLVDQICSLADEIRAVTQLSTPSRSPPFSPVYSPTHSPPPGPAESPAVSPAVSPVMSPAKSRAAEESPDCTTARSPVASPTASPAPVEHLSPTACQASSPALSPCPASSPGSHCSELSLCECGPGSPAPTCPVCGDRTARPRLVLASAALASPPRPGTDLISEQTSAAARRHPGLGFPEPVVVRVPGLSLTDNIRLAGCLDLVSREVGLAGQDWQCQDCSKAVGEIFGPARLCGYTGRYYCSDCHTGDTATIPARLLYNWDGTPRPVARTSLAFLRAVATKPLIDIRSFSPGLGRIAPELDAAHRLRKQLTYLSAYLTACSRAARQGVKVDLAEAVWPRDYLYTETDRYSVEDLEQLWAGQLLPSLTTAVTLCLKHINSCLICSGRGFICELCNDKRPVYPFNLESSSQCRDCHTVFHSHCALQLLSCPKCERLEARNLNRLIIDSKLNRETAEVVPHCK